MLNRIFKIIIIIGLFIGVAYGISISIERNGTKVDSKKIETGILEKIQTKSAEVTAFYTYGRSFNINGKISNVNKDNFESVKLVITDGNEYEKNYNLNYTFEENDLTFSSQKINSTIILDDLNNSDYYVLLRLKLNNSVEPRYYSFTNNSTYNDIQYYTVTKDGKNRKLNLSFLNKEYNGKEYNLLSIKMEDSELPEDVYDIVIDAGHGGKDTGVTSGNISEANLSLEYANLLKQSLEEKGYKVKLTRDENNSDSFTQTNMYDSDGRISIACKSKAKLMISFHVNDDVNKSLTGFEIYSPCKSDLTFATQMASKIKEYSTINYSNNTTYKQAEGVYVENFTTAIIKDFEKTAKKKGYDPYPITTDTPYLYTIREVGGIATGAYVDGRNTQYSKNEYYNSNQGIECYQVELGYIKNDLNVIVNEKNSYIRAITETISDNF